MKNLKLYHNDILIGTVTNITPEDNYDMSGDIALTAEFEKYKPVFDYLLANDGQTNGGEQPFDDSYFEGWILKDEDGHQKPIFIPAIENGEVIWRE